MRHEKKASKVPIQPGGKPISFRKDNRNNQFEVLPTSVLKKHETDIFVYKKKRPISRQEANKPWNLEESQKAIFLEKMFIDRQEKNASLVISFPDEKITEFSVHSYSSNIDTVTFIQSAAPRYCYVTLKPGSNVNEEIANISKIPFEKGFLSAKLRHPIPNEPSPMPREIDPTMLYVGNLLPDISVNEIKEHFANSIRIDVGYSLKKKWRRYALVRYKNAEEAMHAFAVTFGTSIRSTTLIIRFHRIKNWKILQEVELRNEISRLKIKKEKDDAAYDMALKKADGGTKRAALESGVTQLAPARYPIARPLVDISIVKKEPLSPQNIVNTEAPTTSFKQKGDQWNNSNNNWNNCMQYFQYMMYWQQLNSQHQLPQPNFPTPPPNHQMFPFQPQFPNQQQQHPQQLQPPTNSKFSEYPPFFPNIPPPPPNIPPPLPPNVNIQPIINKPPIVDSTISNPISSITSINRLKNFPPTKETPFATMNIPQTGKVDLLKLPRIPKKRNWQKEEYQESLVLESHLPSTSGQSISSRFAPRRQQQCNSQSSGGRQNTSTPPRARNSRSSFGLQQSPVSSNSQQRRDYLQGRNSQRGFKYDDGSKKRRR